MTTNARRHDRDQWRLGHDDNAQAYNDAVTLGTNTILTSNNRATSRSPAPSVAGASRSRLTANAAGTKTFGGAVGGGGNPLTSVTTNGGGTTVLNGGAVTTTGAQTYNDTGDVMAIGFYRVSAGGVFAARRNGEPLGAERRLPARDLRQKHSRACRN